MEKKSVLVVDDTPENIDLLVGLLKSHYVVKAARSGEIALKISKSPAPPDVILLDIQMPGMDGFDVCHGLKKHESTASIPVIFISGTLTEQDREEGRSLGVLDFLIKPVDPARLKSALRSVLEP